MRPIIITALALILIPVALAQDSQYQTQTFANGRVWKNASMEGRLSYLIGFYEGLQVSIMTAAKSTAKDKLVADIDKDFDCKLNNSEIASGVTEFYQDSANAPIPIPAAIAYVVMKAKGATTKELEDRLSFLRKTNNSN